MRQAFTLIELLVAISIIAVLSALSLVAFNGSRAAARDVRRVADLEAIRRALELYRDANGMYPVSGWVDSNPASPPAPDWIPGLVPNYISGLPVDPINTGAGPGLGSTGLVYAYWSSAWCNGVGGKEYLLIARMESGKAQGSPFGDCTWGNSTPGGWYVTGEP